MFYDMAVKQRHSTGVGGYWYKSLAGYGENDAMQCAFLESGSCLNEEESVLRTEAVPEKGWTSARQYRMSCRRPPKDS